MNYDVGDLSSISHKHGAFQLITMMDFTKISGRIAIECGRMMIVNKISYSYLRMKSDFVSPINNGYFIVEHNRACYQNSHNAIFHRNFQKYSVKILNAVTD